MEKPSAPETPSSVTQRIKSALETNFRSILVEGEISNWKPSAAGHVYFNLKDAGAVLPCAFFSITSRRLAFQPRDGVKVRASGDIGVYAPRGNYQLIVRALEPAGIGDLMARLEELKRKLLAEGLFDHALKRPLPLLPRKIGVVTSPTGAVIRDILNVAARRFPSLNIVLAPARVQGEGADLEIIEGLHQLNALPDPPDAIIVARGGGSIEDLWCFNSEALARAIRASRIPVISAVGHETDTTICDHAADLRAPTPSAAAELVAACKETLDSTVDILSKRLSGAMRSTLENARARVSAVSPRRLEQSLRGALRQNQQRFDFASQRLARTMPDTIASAKNELTHSSTRLVRSVETALRAAAIRLGNFEARLNSSNPEIVLKRGYAMLKNRSGEVLTSAAQIEPNDVVNIRLSDGDFDALALGSARPASDSLMREPALAAPRRRKPKNSQDAQLDLFQDC